MTACGTSRHFAQSVAFIEAARTGGQDRLHRSKFTQSYPPPLQTLPTRLPPELLMYCIG